MAKKTAKKPARYVGCTVKELPDEMKYAAAVKAAEINPVNLPAGVQSPQRIAVLTGKYWGAKGAELTVSFMEQTSTQFRDKLMGYFNSVSEFCNIKARWVKSGGQVRVGFVAGGYWSYLGTDILQIPANQQTMNLEGFTLKTPESEWRRVVVHEWLHTCGCPHEHMRAELVSRLDPAKTIAYFGKTQGWSADEVRAQVLTPLEERSVMGTPHAEETSIMCYGLPGSITTDGRPIPGGSSLTELDKSFLAGIYPLSASPTGPVGVGKLRVSFTIDPATKKVEDLAVS